MHLKGVCVWGVVWWKFGEKVEGNLFCGYRILFRIWDIPALIPRRPAFYDFNLATCILHLTEKENLCLYGFPNELWEVNLPAEEVPPELPEPALGINFARDGMQEKDWLSLVAVHSDAWLLAVAFYFGARFGFDKADRFFISPFLFLSLDIIAARV